MGDEETIVSSTSPSGGSVGVPAGFEHWMRRVLAERARVSEGFSPDPVHDLRVALRRCRSLAWGMRFADPHPGWRRVQRDGRALFRALGELRDAQVLLEIARKLGTPRDPVRGILVELLARREADLIQAARAPLEAFRSREWTALEETLAPRVRSLEADGPFFEFLAVRLLAAADALHRRASRYGNPAAWHELRIGIKRFRYVVENFLPRRHARWGAGLKRMQDLLGEVHDLDVLWATLCQLGPVFDAKARQRWRRLLDRRRLVRIDRYRRSTTGPQSLWGRWRRGLPSPDELESATTARIAAWLDFADPAISDTRRTAGFALELFDQLSTAGAGTVFVSARARRLLETAALCRGVGATLRRGRPKVIARRIRDRLPQLVDWPASEVETIVTLVRRHRGRPPWPGDSSLAGLSQRGRTTTLALAGVLRLAVVLDAASPGDAAALRLRRTAETLVIEVPDLSSDGRTHALLARERAVLEAVLGRPIVVTSPDGEGAAPAAATGASFADRPVHEPREERRRPSSAGSSAGRIRGRPRSSRPRGARARSR
jgi:CHAD domain-containing protein